MKTIMPILVLFIVTLLNAVIARPPTPTYPPYTTAYYSCDCSYEEKPKRNNRIWIAQLATGKQNKPPSGYEGVIIRVIKSEKGARPSGGYARINAKLDNCKSPFAHLKLGCTYRVQVTGKRIRGINHFIVDRCYPPEEIECPKPTGCYK